MYRIIPLRILRRTRGVKFDEMVPSDIPKISGIDRVIHGANSISPGPVEDIEIPIGDILGLRNLGTCIQDKMITY